NAPMRLAASSTSNDKWPFVTGVFKYWASGANPAAPASTIAVVDSGIDATRPEFAGRIVANVNLSTLPGNSPGDGRGHGTLAAGNYGSPTGPSGVPFAPGNDPFVITVGASDTGRSVSTNDDTSAPWSAYGYTLDGFAKPELAAPGRYIVGPVPVTSTLYSERPDHVVEPGYMELSGTSFAAPIASGVAAL